MKLMFDSNNTNFLKLYKSTIRFLDKAKVAIGNDSDIIYFLSDYGLTLEDLEAVGIKTGKHEIEIPKGTKAEVLDCKKNETLIRVGGDTDEAIEFDINLTPEADFVMVECSALEDERENIFSKYDDKLPNEKSKDELYGINIYNLLNAVNELRFGGNNKRNAFEYMKLLTEEELTTVYNRQQERLKIKEMEEILDKNL